MVSFNAEVDQNTAMFCQITVEKGYVCGDLIDFFWVARFDSIWTEDAERKWNTKASKINGGGLYDSFMISTIYSYYTFM